MKWRLPYRRGTVRVSSLFGMRVLFGETGMHKGVDLVGSDKEIVAPCAGRIGWAGMVDDSGSGGRTHEWGNYVRLETDGGYAVYFCHMASVAVRMGQKVQAGEKLGTEGSTGKSTGSHLHFEVRKNNVAVDPTPFLGIENKYLTHTVKEEEDYASLVCRKCGLEAQTKAYLNRYKYADDLWRKLWEAMK